MNFCPKCGNDVRGAKFCSKCGNPVNEQISGGQNATVFPEKKGFFQQRKENKDARHKKAANECSRQMAAAFIAEKERFREKEALEKELAIFDECQKDLDFQKDVQIYWDLQDEIEKRYSMLTNMDGGFFSPAADTLLSICETHIILNKKLRPKWEKYGYPKVKTVAYQREAMTYEKKGMYHAAANTCLRAIKDDHENDGTKGGMSGRMMRMLKKGNLKPTPEMMTEIEKRLN